MENPNSKPSDEKLENAIEMDVINIIEYKEIKEENKNVSEEIGEEDGKEVINEALMDPIQDSESKEGVTDKPVSKLKKILTGFIIALSAVLFYYLVIAMFFINHFYIGTEINGINVSCKSAKAVEVLMTSKLNAYALNLIGRGGNSEYIKATEIGLKYNPEEFEKLISNQNPFNWAFVCFNTNNSKFTITVTYDENLLDEQMNRLSCIDSNKIVEPKNAGFEYIDKDNQYRIIDEILGTKADKEVLKLCIVEAIQSREAQVDLELANCYINPQYISDSQKTIEVRDTLNKYIAAHITYTFGNQEEIISGSQINQWLTVNESFEIEIDNKKLEEYVCGLSERYNISGRTRNFTTTSGNRIQVDGGDFANSIDVEKEIQKIISLIKEGQTQVMESSYCDIGNTYVEIDLTNQHIWFYKNDSLIIEGDIVTGNVSTGHTTPKGVYRLKYKAKNVVLRGPDYAAPVTFWMPFNGGIGMHDANWRSVFGGEIYKANGSHGCINCPYHLVEEIYNNIEVETPVVCY